MKLSLPARWRHLVGSAAVVPEAISGGGFISIMKKRVRAFLSKLTLEREGNMIIYFFSWDVFYILSFSDLVCAIFLWSMRPHIFIFSDLNLTVWGWIRSEPFDQSDGSDLICLSPFGCSLSPLIFFKSLLFYSLYPPFWFCTSLFLLKLFLYFLKFLS